METERTFDQMIDFDADRDLREAFGFLDSVVESGMFNPLEIHIRRFRYAAQNIVTRFGRTVSESFKPLK